VSRVPEAGPSTAGRRIAGATALITGLTIVARIAGFARTSVFAHTVGKDGLANVYNAANTVPNIVFELVAGGALASLVVPLLAGGVRAGDRERVGAVASALLTWVLTLMVPLALIVAIAAGPIAGLFHDVPPDHQAVFVRLLRIFAPQLPLYGIGVVLTGVLQAHRRFAWPVIAPLLSSVTVMGAYLTYAGIDGARSDFARLSRTGELVLAAGTTLGVVVLAGCLLVPLRRLRLRWRPSYRFPGGEGRQAARLGWAGAVTVGAQQIVLGLIIVFGTGDDGPLTLFTFAQTIFLLPWAVLAVPLATAAYPALAEAAARHDEGEYARTLAGTARSVTLLACLGAAALAVLAGPIVVSVLDAPDAAPGVVGFAPGLLGYALFALLSRALYARGATVAAAAATAAGWGVAALAVPAVFGTLDGDRQVLGLGLANALGMSVIGLLLVLAVRRHAGPAALAGLGRATAAGIAAALVAGLAGWGVVTGLGRLAGAAPTVAGSLVQGMLGGVVVLGVFAAVAYGLDRRDLAPLAGLFAKRSKARKSA
jgi:putative peptidoglycan lipid II flippase